MSTDEARAPVASTNGSENSTHRPHLVVRESSAGRCFEDFAVGDRYEHRVGRTVLAKDNSSFALLMQATAAAHYAGPYTQETGWGRPLVDSALALAIVSAQSVADLAMQGLEDVAWERVEIAHPVFEGDTLCSRSTVLGKRASMSPDAGVMRVRTEGFNQDGVVVIWFDRSVKVSRRPASIAPAL